MNTDNTATSTRRSKTVEWSDPAEVMSIALGRSGFDALAAMAEGDVPVSPMAELMGLRPVHLEHGRVIVSAQPEELFSNGMGAAHGGYCATLIDSAAWLALHSHCAVGQFCSTLQLNIHYTRGFPLDGRELTTEGRVLHFGKETAMAEATVSDADGRRLAHGTTHCVVRSIG